MCRVAEVSSGMQLNARLTASAEALLTAATKEARAPWVDRKVALVRAWNSLDEHDRHLLCYYLGVRNGQDFVRVASDRLGAEDSAKRAANFALAGVR